MTRATVRRLPIVIVLVVAASSSRSSSGDADPDPCAAGVDARRRRGRTPAPSTRSSAWFCPGVPGVGAARGADAHRREHRREPTPTSSSPCIPTTARARGGADRRGAGEHGQHAARARRSGRRVRSASSRRSRVDVVVEHGVDERRTLAVGPCAIGRGADWYFAAGTTGTRPARRASRRDGSCCSTRSAPTRRSTSRCAPNERLVAPKRCRRSTCPRRIARARPDPRPRGAHARRSRSQVARDRRAASSPRRRWCSAPSRGTPGVDAQSRRGSSPSPVVDVRRRRGDAPARAPSIAIVNPGRRRHRGRRDRAALRPSVPLTVAVAARRRRVGADRWLRRPAAPKAASRCRPTRRYTTSIVDRRRHADRRRADRVLRRRRGRRRCRDGASGTAGRGRRSSSCPRSESRPGRTATLARRQPGRRRR